MRIISQLVMLAGLLLMVGLCGCENTDEIPATSESPHSSVDHSHSQDDEVPPKPEVTHQDEGACLISETRINKNNPRFDQHYRSLFKADTYVAYPSGSCTKYIYYSDGSKEVREEGFDYLAVMPRIDLHDFKINGDKVEIEFETLTSADIVVNELELEEAFGTSVYKIEVLRPAKLAHQGTVREGYVVSFFRKDQTWEEIQVFNSFPQTFDVAANTLFIDVSKNREFFDKCLEEGSLTVKVYTAWDASWGWSENFIFRHPLVLEAK